jgi:hypothetical protein
MCYHKGHEKALQVTNNLAYWVHSVKKKIKGCESQEFIFFVTLKWTK